MLSEVCMQENIFIKLSNLIENLAGYKFLVLNFSSFSSSNILLHCLFASQVADEKFDVSMTFIPF